MKANGDALFVRMSLIQRAFDIVCLTETWVKEPKIMDDIFQPKILSFSLKQLVSKYKI